jgi:molybdopterin synthase catalytic subunit
MPFLTRDPIAIDRLLCETASPECGGTCVFLGTVRSGPDDGGVTTIEYSAYEPMVAVELNRIVAEVRARWPQARTALRHRLGTIPVGDASIAIVAAAPHRADAFDSCRYLIEAVKQRLPIWKKECRMDGSTIWVDPAGHSAAAPPP